MIHCKNCEQGFEGNFCPNCGQKVINKRFNLKDSLSWLLNSIFNLDHGFLYTTKELMVNPGQVIRSVLNGVTINYTHPFRLLFVWATLTTILTLALGIYDEQTAELYQSMDFSEAQRAFQDKINSVMKKYLNFIILANVPFISIFSLLFYRKKQLNFTEHLVMNAFGYSLTTAIGVILIFIQYFFHAAAIMVWFNILLNVIIMGYTYSSTFKENYFKSFFKYLLAFVLSYFLLMILTIVIIIVLALLSKLMGFDFLDIPQNK